jgi:hypothetical protein
MSRVTAPLLTADARDLWLLHRPRWQRRLLAWTLPAAMLALVAAHTIAVGPATCTAQAPCRPDWLAAVSIGLLVASAAAGISYPRLATWFAGGFVVLLILSERLLRPALVSPAWLYIVDVGYVALCVLLAGVSRDRRPTERAQRWLAGVRRQRLPETTRTPRPGGGWRAVGWLLALPAAACLCWGWYAQTQAEAREQAASRATGEVTRHVDDFRIEVQLSGETRTVNVYDALNYPVGQRIELYVDDQGLRQPVAEPYDATLWLVLGTLLAGIAAASRARGRESGQGQRQFFNGEQPVTEVSVLPVFGGVAVYAGDARVGEPALLRIRSDPAALAPDLQPATLYGIPAPGHWCAVLAQGTLAVPSRPVSASALLPTPPYGYVRPAPDGSPPPRVSDLPLRDEEVEALRTDDWELAADAVLTHRRSPLSGYLSAAAMPLAGSALVRFLPALSYGVGLLIAASALAVSCLLAWRAFLRPRIAWNSQGVAVVGTFGDRRVGWRMVSGIDHDRDSVTVHTGYRSLVVSAAPKFRLLGRHDRNAEELANALRHARACAPSTATAPAPETPSPDTPFPTAFDALEGLPRLDPPRAPAGLYLLWLAGTPLLAWLIEVLSTV